MNLVFTWKELIVKDGAIIVDRFPASCNVRHELNGRRPLHDRNQVQYTIPVQGSPMPYMPRQYPSGIHGITAVEWTTDPEYEPAKIRTTATRDVFLWRVDNKGGYDCPSGAVQTDSAYHIHYTKSKTTLGCIRCNNRNNMIKLAKIIENELAEDRPIFLEVL